MELPHPDTLDDTRNWPPSCGGDTWAGESAVVEAIKVQEKAIREAQTKASDIDTGVYDLKAVNPHVKAVSDMRTVLEIIENTICKGRLWQRQ
ncbi:MAG: hypothetical protein ACXWTS_02580 [Methylococcaceae bacterium]